MASTLYTLTSDWDATNRYTAAADVDIMLSNSGTQTILYEITTSDTAPSLSVTRGHRIVPSENKPMQLVSGERLWMAGSGAHGTLVAS